VYEGNEKLCLSKTRVNKDGKYTQHFMQNGGFPFIPSTTVNPGNPLLFGAEGEAILFRKVPKYSNGVVKLDGIRKKTLIGYVVGGIKSTVPNTSSQADSSPSQYLFKIFVEPVCHCSNS
jgi:hypothetical protein